MSSETPLKYEELSQYSVVETILAQQLLKDKKDLSSPPTVVGARADAPRIDLPPPDFTHRYSFKSTLGEGGMGRVDLVMDLDLMRKLAVKRIRPDLEEYPEVIQHFLWEARLCATLDHPNIVPVYDLGMTPSNQLFFTMKYIDGKPLSQIIQEVKEEKPEVVEQYPLNRRLRLFLQVLQAVKVAHKRGVLHRDLKPSNIMVGLHGEVYLMDWGLAAPSKICKDPEILKLFANYKQDDAVVGTPYYMSPEQASGKISEVEERSDIYSLGVILYELTSLERPYKGTDTEQIVKAIKNYQVCALEEFACSLSSSAIAVIEKAMAQAPPDRYQTIEEFYYDVECLIDHQTPKAEKASWARKSLRMYLGHHKSFSHLTVMDIDTMSIGSVLVGIALGIWLASWLGGWEWWLLISGIFLCIPFILSFFGVELHKWKNGGASRSA